MPHDAMHEEWGTRRTRVETLRQLGRNPYRVAKVSVQDGINAGNRTIRLARFDADRCALGIDGLRNYRREWDDELKTFRENPVKDWSEHIGSAFRYLALAWREEVPRIVKPKEQDLILTARPDGSVVSNIGIREAVEAMARRKRRHMAD